MKNGIPLGVIIPMLAMAAIAERSRQAEAKAENNSGESKSGRSTNQALGYVREILDAAQRGAGVEVEDHSGEVSETAKLVSKISGILSVLDIEHTVTGFVVECDPLSKADTLPDWAVGHNEKLALVPGATLLTKDGRHVGNAGLACVHEGYTYPYCVVTDIGNHMHLTADQVEELFYIGPYLQDPAEIAARRK